MRSFSIIALTLSTAFEHQTKIHIVPSLGATAQLTQQIGNGAPFTAFLAGPEAREILKRFGYIQP